jgi:hypothetical protein
MSHDKIRAAARERMARTGESYAAARRAVIKEHPAAASETPRPRTQWFAISYDASVSGKITTWMDSLFGGGPGKSGVAVNRDTIQVQMAGDRFEIPRRSVRSASRSDERLRGTTGVHMHKKGQLLVNGSAEGLVEVIVDPPFHTGRMLSTAFVKERVNSFLVSLVDPDGFIAAIEDDSQL